MAESLGRSAFDPGQVGSNPSSATDQLKTVSQSKRAHPFRAGSMVTGAPLPPTERCKDLHSFPSTSEQRIVQLTFGKTVRIQERASRRDQRGQHTALPEAEDVPVGSSRARKCLNTRETWNPQRDITVAGEMLALC